MPRTVTSLEPTFPKSSIDPSIPSLPATLSSPLLASPSKPKNIKCALSTLAYEARESSELGEYVASDVALLKSLGWEAFVKSKRGRGDIGLLDKRQASPRQPITTTLQEPWSSCSLLYP